MVSLEKKGNWKLWVELPAGLDLEEGVRKKDAGEGVLGPE